MAFYPPPIAGDLDSDGDVDLRDLALFRLCTPWQGEVSAVCRHPAADMDNDGDVDLTDFAVFRTALTGPSSPAK
jgi:hypothetical protein